VKSKSHTKCPICYTANSPATENYYRCGVCDSFYMFPIKLKDYTNGYWDAYYYSGNINNDHVDQFANIIARKKKVFNDSVLDVGAGHGYFLYAHGGEVMGLDNNAIAIDRAKLTFGVHIDELDVEDPFTMIQIQGTLKVKTVTLHHTIECFRTPVQTMKYLKTFADEYFHILVQKPTVTSLKPVNFCLFNVKTIEVLSDKIGCELVEFEQNEDYIEAVLSV